MDWAKPATALAAWAWPTADARYNRHSDGNLYFWYPWVPVAGNASSRRWRLSSLAAGYDILAGLLFRDNWAKAPLKVGYSAVRNGLITRNIHQTSLNLHSSRHLGSSQYPSRICSEWQYPYKLICILSGNHIFLNVERCHSRKAYDAHLSIVAKFSWHRACGNARD